MAETFRARRLQGCRDVHESEKKTKTKKHPGTAVYVFKRSLASPTVLKRYNGEGIK